MGSYSEIASDEFLLKEVGDSKSVTIIGCPYCANQSIAYSKDIDIIGESTLGGLRSKAYLTTQEANRIRELLENKGKSANIKIFGFPHWGLCWQNAKDRSAVAKECKNSDAVIALSCFAGCEGIKSALPKSFKVVPGMATLGTISAYLSVEKGKIVIDKAKTKVVRFREMRPQYGSKEEDKND